jgi:hypothetical protein
MRLTVSLLYPSCGSDGPLGYAPAALDIRT